MHTSQSRTKHKMFIKHKPKIQLIIWLSKFTNLRTQFISSDQVNIVWNKSHQPSHISHVLSRREHKLEQQYFLVYARVIVGEMNRNQSFSKFLKSLFTKNLQYTNNSWFWVQGIKLKLWQNKNRRIIRTAQIIQDTCCITNSKFHMIQSMTVCIKWSQMKWNTCQQIETLVQGQFTDMASRE